MHIYVILLWYSIVLKLQGIAYSWAEERRSSESISIQRASKRRWDYYRSFNWFSKKSCKSDTSIRRREEFNTYNWFSKKSYKSERSIQRREEFKTYNWISKNSCKSCKSRTRTTCWITRYQFRRWWKRYTWFSEICGNRRSYETRTWIPPSDKSWHLRAILSSKCMRNLWWIHNWYKSFCLAA